jgi:hypothetical protein
MELLPLHNSTVGDYPNRNIILINKDSLFLNSCCYCIC